MQKKMHVQLSRNRPASFRFCRAVFKLFTWITCKAVVAALLLLPLLAFPCTTFFIYHNGQMVFGRNYDWMANAGMVCTNQRGLFKTSAVNKDGKTISWQSLYGSITFNQYGKEFPTGGMNEKGLVVELMWLDETKYPEPDDRPAIGVLQWIQYQLDNCSTIEQVIATDKKLRIVSDGTPLHYLVADSNGQSAVIEFLSGKMVVHKGKDLPIPVLTNNTYEQSVLNEKKGLPAGDNSLARFSTACKMLREYTAGNVGASLVDHSFHMLDMVSQGEFTKWSIVYDITAKKIYFKTNQSPQVRSMMFSSFDFNCSESSMTVDINRSQAGDLENYFEKFSDEFNRSILEIALQQSASRITLTEGQKRAAFQYPGTIYCK